MPKKHEPIKDAIPKRYVPKKRVKQGGAKTPTREKKWVQNYSPKSENKYSPCSQKSQKEKGMAYEFIKNTKIFHPLAQS